MVLLMASRIMALDIGPARSSAHLCTGGETKGPPLLCRLPIEIETHGYGNRARAKGTDRENQQASATSTTHPCTHLAATVDLNGTSCRGEGIIMHSR